MEMSVIGVGLGKRVVHLAEMDHREFGRTGNFTLDELILQALPGLY
jgi:hypothetical protein